MVDDDDEDVSARLNAEERGAAVHEAGHAVVAHAFKVTIKAVYIALGGGGMDTGGEQIDITENLAICIAGGKAEQIFNASTHSKSAKCGDFRTVRRLLLHKDLAQSERRRIHAEGHRLAEQKLRDIAEVVQRLAGALFAHHRIEGAELTTLLQNPI